jgi:mRNA-degrading endonuclease RelE of RelBE toxin-antitoxin system
MRRVRLDQWRVIYAVHDQAHWVWVLGIYRRPPYDYSDLAELAARLPP